MWDKAKETCLQSNSYIINNVNHRKPNAGNVFAVIGVSCFSVPSTKKQLNKLK